MNHSGEDKLEQEIKGLFQHSIERLDVADQIVSASHTANRQRGVMDIVTMLGRGAVAVMLTAINPASVGSKLRENNYHE
ncbi:hypothetical protein [Gynuella sunshinyii]|uniref:Uncharacterized protein n=1 Tax=Gynuella sunshinyii YC6258 TaxID=1445510 RepID=A0A0C5VC05_9GAMM|nr:hypothetical protein [Gynuella sunshinyii]AJQ96885.1 hypothetical Protein YC6258_04853 [Gynuella sunshinyii YC6258]